MSVNLDNVQWASNYNAFKNDNNVYTGTIIMPSSLPATGQSVTTKNFALSSAPTFSSFFAQYTEQLDLIQLPNGTYANQQWYPLEVGALFNVGVWVTAPSAQQGVISGAIYPSINGTTLTVQTVLNNPYNVGITLGPLTIPFAFCTFSLAN